MKHKIIKLWLTMFISMICASSFAHDIEVENSDGVPIYYVYTNNKTELAVSYQGSSYNSRSYSGNVVIPESVSYNRKTYSVTSIGSQAFRGCSGLTSVIIPNSVTSIGELAFAVSNLASMTIPNSVTSIGELAFAACSNLVSIEVEAGNSAFVSEDGVLFNKNKTTILCYPIGKTSSTYSIPNSVTRVGDYAFYGCSGLTSVTIPNSVTSIGSSAFSSCYGLTSVTIPNSVTSIGEEAFLQCEGLTSVTIPNSVTSIGSSAFSGCSGLTSIEVEAGNSAFVAENGVLFNKDKTTILCYPASKTSSTYSIPNSVTRVGDYAFYGCSSLTSVTIPNSVTSIGQQAFYNCYRLTAVHISDLAAWCNISFGSGANPLYYAHHLYLNGEEVKDLIIPESVTSIGDYAFSGCSGLTSVNIPNSVTSIGGYAFDRCSGLTSVIIPNSVTSIGERAFYYCSGLTSVKVGMESPLSIDSNTFSDRANSTLYVPAGSKEAYETANYWKEFMEIVEYEEERIISFADSNVKAICVQNWDTNGDGELSEAEAAAVTDLGKVFQNQTNITSFDELQYFTGLTSIGQYAFSGCSGLNSVTIPNSVTSIGQFAFQGCSGLTSVTIPSSVTSIGIWAFYGCNRLTSVTIPNSVTSIGKNAFSYCSSLTSVHISDLAAWCNISFGSSNDANPLWYAHHLYLNGEEVKDLVIPNSVTSIGQYAFSGCSGLTSVTIPNSVTSIGQYAFRGCSGLTAVTIPSSVTSIGIGAFNGCTRLTSVTIPESVTSIGSYAFQDCSGLTAVTIPNSVTSIGSFAFENCSGLTSITIPESVTTIGNYVFYKCSGLTSVTIPNSVTSIRSYAFSSCSSLTSVTVEMETPLAIAENTFSNRTNATLYVPAGCKAAYEAAQYWQDFNIVEMGSSLEPTDISQIDNVIYMEPQEVPIGSRGTLSFKMKNNAPIRGFQFDLYLPEGMTVATSSNGKVEASLNATKLPEGDSHLLTASIQDGFVRFLCNSQYDENFAVGDDIVLTLKVNVSEDMQEGDYPVELKTVKLSETDISKYYLTELVRSKVTVGSYLLGDVNADGVVDISDYISMANYIHGNVAEGFVFRAGDIDGNGSIDISDYIGVSNIIHTGSPSGNSQAGAKAALFPSGESQEKDPE